MALLALVLVLGAVGPAPLAAPVDLAELVDGGSELVDVHQVTPGELRAGLTIPGRPDAEWAPPPCPRGYLERNGACWLLAVAPPPCPAATYEHAGRCYTPLMRGTRPPTTVDQ